MADEILLIFVMVLTSATDAWLDRAFGSKYTRPNSWLPWPFLDVRHLTKKIQVYTPFVYIMAICLHPHILPDLWQTWAIGATLSFAARRLVPALC